MVFNTKTRTGTFYNATGTATLREAVEPNIFGAQEPDAFFWGDELHKIGPKKYRIIRGGFTTCVQPTPRWEMRSGSITLNLDEYAILKNAVFRVKNVPLMFLPVFYYPIQEDDRATGFLMPIYGSTTTQGQSITNQFFWAINRSQDATIEHDWFSKTGQRVGGEYRYVGGPGSQGNAQMALLNEHPTTYAQPDGTVVNYDGKRSYRSSAAWPSGSRSTCGRAQTPTTRPASSRGSGTSRISTSRRTGAASFGGNLSGSWSAYSISVTADKNDYFRNATSFQTTGSLPRISFARGEQAIGGAPLYFGVNSEYVTLARSTSEDDEETSNTGLTRFDVNPTLRIPFNRWQFFTVNSVVSWRGTYWTESLDVTSSRPVQVPVGIGRRYLDFQARITGPVFNRIWNTDNNSYAQKFKHVIEPTLTIQRVTPIDNFARIVKLDGVDYSERKSHSPQLRFVESSLCQEAILARDREPPDLAELLHGRERGSLRPAGPGRIRDHRSLRTTVRSRCSCALRQPTESRGPSERIGTRRRTRFDLCPPAAARTSANGWTPRSSGASGGTSPDSGGSITRHRPAIISTPVRRSGGRAIGSAVPTRFTTT